eukprot:Lankesteria_metandrocarpae@DN4122_c0_g1_i1.p1
MLSVRSLAAFIFISPTICCSTSVDEYDVRRLSRMSLLSSQTPLQNDFFTHVYVDQAEPQYLAPPRPRKKKTCYDFLMDMSHNWQSLEWGLASGVFCGLGNVFQTIALSKDNAGRVSLWASLTTIMVPIVQGIMNKHVSSNLWIAAAVASCGALLVESSNSNQTITFPVWGFNTFLLITQMMSFSFSCVIASEGMVRFPRSAMTLTAGLLLSGFLTAVAWLLIDTAYCCIVNDYESLMTLFDEMTVVITDSSVAIALLWTGAFTIALTAWAENWALSQLPPVEHVVLIATAPIWTGIWCWFFQEKPLTLKYLGGVTLTILGVVVSQFPWLQST